MPARPKKPGKPTQCRLRPHKMLECLEAHDRIGDAVRKSGTALTRFEIGSHQLDSRARRPPSRLSKQGRVHVDSHNIRNSSQLGRPIANPAGGVDDRLRAEFAQEVNRKQVAAEMLSFDPDMRVARVEWIDRARIRRAVNSVRSCTRVSPRLTAPTSAALLALP